MFGPLGGFGLLGPLDGLGSFGPLGGFGLLGPFGVSGLFGPGFLGLFGLLGLSGPFGLLGALGAGPMGGGGFCAAGIAFGSEAPLFEASVANAAVATNAMDHAIFRKCIALASLLEASERIETFQSGIMRRKRETKP